ncbi:MAG: glycerate kinase, partial [Mariprofundaceae bacterium]|nr:glycerate kinase [Mariprofundaceae bacterium]
MRILIAPDAFKGSLSAAEAAAAMASGIAQAVPDAELVCHPLADGGEGTLEVLLPRLHGRRVSFRGADGTYCYGIGRDEDAQTVALIESASLIGLTLPSMQQYPVESRSSAALGETISHALAQGIRHFVIGLGGTATNDGGIGMLSALGMRCMDTVGGQVPPALSGLMDVAAMDISGMDRHLFTSRFTVLSDVFNPLCGPDGGTIVFGP